VNCARLHQVLDAFVDNELDPTTMGDVTLHLSQCVSCTALRDQRVALQQTVRAHGPYFEAPATLASAVRGALEKAEKRTEPVLTPRVRNARQFSWFQAAAFASVTALAGLFGGYWLAQSGSTVQFDHAVNDQLVTSHVASLAHPRELTAVISTDQHTVKPWFQGKIDIAPPVKDLSREGFELLGGRVDQVAGKPGAAVVYKVRNHVINLFVWRANEPVAAPIATANVRGFSVTTWSGDGLRFVAVSDVGAQDLTRFAQLVASP
jgi:anti-sigma factor RsiW